jgi:hypothetical protein
MKIREIVLRDSIKIGSIVRYQNGNEYQVTDVKGDKFTYDTRWGTKGDSTKNFVKLGNNVYWSFVHRPKEKIPWTIIVEPRALANFSGTASGVLETANGKVAVKGAVLHLLKEKHGVDLDIKLLNWLIKLGKIKLEIG